MPDIITFAIQKGGVGKTTGVTNTAFALAQLGFKILVIDADPNQSNTTTTMIKDLSQRETYSLYKALGMELESGHMSTMACPGRHENLDIIPASIGIQDWESNVKGTPDETQGFARLIKDDDGLKKYDFIFIDTPPSKGSMLYNSLMISDYIIVPIPVSDQYAIDGFALFYETVKKTKIHNKKLSILGIQLTKIDGRAPTLVSTAEKLRGNFERRGLHVFETTIKLNVDLYKAQTAHKTIFEFDPKKSGALDFDNFAKELIGLIKKIKEQ